MYWNFVRVNLIHDGDLHQSKQTVWACIMGLLKVQYVDHLSA